MDNDKTIYINLPFEIEGSKIEDIISEKVQSIGMNFSNSSPQKDSLFINLKEIQTKTPPSLGYLKDSSGNTYFKDKQSIIYHFNKKLNAFCLAPQTVILIEKILGLGKISFNKSKSPAVKTLKLYTEKYLEDYSDGPISPTQVVSKSNTPEIINSIYSSGYTEIYLHGNLDYLIPWIHPTRHCSINIYSNPDTLKHKLTTRVINNEYFFEIKIKDKTSRLFYDLFTLALRKVILDKEYEVPFDQHNTSLETFKKAEFIKSRIETYYELLMFGVKYSTYLFEDGFNNRDEKFLFAHQGKINEICVMLKKIESQFFCFEISNEYLFVQLQTMPPASLTDLALLQKEAFEETALIISAFFDLIKSLLKFKPKEESQNGRQ